MIYTFATAVVILLIVGFFLAQKSASDKNQTLTVPTFFQQITKSQPKSASTPTPTLAPPVAPKTFKFNSKSDLEIELKKVNPEVLDSDFEELTYLPK